MLRPQLSGHEQRRSHETPQEYAHRRHRQVSVGAHICRGRRDGLVRSNVSHCLNKTSLNNKKRYQNQVPIIWHQPMHRFGRKCIDGAEGFSVIFPCYFL